jgi:hypothetical protein
MNLIPKPAIAIAFIWMICCSLNCTKAGKDLDERLFFPMSVGNQWEYSYEIGGGADVQSFLSGLMGSPKWSQTIRVISESEGAFLFEVTNFIGNNPSFKNKYLYEYRNDMIMQIASGGGPYDKDITPMIPKHILMKFPLSDSASWTYKDQEAHNHFLRVGARYDSVTVSGTLYKHVIEISDSIPDNKIEYRQYAYSVGLIKVEAMLIDPETRKRDEFLRRIPSYAPKRTPSFQLTSYKLVAKK